MMQTRWLSRLTWLYLALPFIIFCMGWLRLAAALPVVLVMLWALGVLWKSTASTDNLISTRVAILVVVLTGLWVFLSGVGGYAFQNWDHNWRNAVLRDLITYHWPVVYSSPDKGPIKILVSSCGRGSALC
jgi:uncharacterized membrane protein